ncbi:MAG TPA: VOC family protein [Acidimicrobiales bacterium]|nr:VOC family protein [Acidimicrobiales bacterium]
MDRINHVKIVTPQPDAIDHFLREVLDIPEGWSLGDAGDAGDAGEARDAQRHERAVISPARGADGRFTAESVQTFQGASGFGGRITGSTESRQFQILRGDRAHIWAVAVGTRHLERAHARCIEQGIPCTEPRLTAWGSSGIRFFFAEVGGIVFEVMRAEPEGPAAPPAG